MDTWGWLALGYKKDPSHLTVKHCYQELRREGKLLYTSDFVLNELITLLFRRETFKEAHKYTGGILQAVETECLHLENVSPERFISAWELRGRFNDKPLISFTDLTTMVIMSELGINMIVTSDHHFTKVGLGFVLLPG